MSRVEILAARKGFVQGFIRASNPNPYTDPPGWLVRAAAEAFPLPKVRRSRVITTPEGTAYRLYQGRVEYRMKDSIGWTRSNYTVDTLRAFADLAKNPTEEVEDDGR